VQWNHYVKRGEGWAITIELDRASSRWSIWYCSREDGSKALGCADTPQNCAALLTKDRFANFQKQPPDTIFTEQFPDGWCRLQDLDTKTGK
jgi:hypothetical protein